jgi:D-alanyl-D-alanine carboxypeptidase
VIENTLSRDRSLENEANDTLITQRGSADRDALRGSAGQDTLYGLAGDDVLQGYTGSDLLDGGTGSDRLIGDRGNDLFLDRDGGDWLIGGEGSDQFQLGGFDVPAVPTAIADFQLGSDVIKIARLGATFENLSIQNADGGATISDRGQLLATLSGIDATDLTSNSFSFGDRQLADRFQSALDRSLSASGAPGLTEAIITPDGFTWEGATGVSNVSTGMAMQPDDLLAIGSISKAITAATTLRLTEDGILSLDDTLGQWLPEIAQSISGGEDITVRQLLNGKGGIAPYSLNQQFQTDVLSNPAREWHPEELVSFVEAQPRFTGPGTSPIWAYTDTTTVLTGLVIEQATGQSVASVIRQEVLDPLGMSSTFAAWEEPVGGERVQGYADLLDATGSPGADGILEPISVSPSAGWANGGLVSNAEDVARFSQALFSGELLEPASLNEMLTFVEEGIPFEGDRFGFGVVQFDETPLGRAWGKNGSFPGYQAEMRYFPERGGATIAALANRGIGTASQAPDVLPPVLSASIDTLQRNATTTDLPQMNSPFTASPMSETISTMNQDNQFTSTSLPTSPLDVTREGNTSVTLSNDLVNALETLQVQVESFGNTNLADGVAEFPIVGGAADVDSARVDLLHDGGLTFSTPNTTVNLTDFIVTNLDDRAVLTGLVSVNGDL